MATKAPKTEKSPKTRKKKTASPDNQITEKKPKATKTRVKAHWRVSDNRQKQKDLVAKLTDEDSPLPDDPNDEVDQRTSAMAADYEETVRQKKTYARKLTPAKVRAALTETGGIILQAAEMLNVSRTSLYQWIERHEDVKAYLTDLREEICDAAESQIYVAIMAGNIAVAQWYLTRMATRRGYADKQQAVGVSGEPIDIRKSIVEMRPVLAPDGPRPANPIL